MKMGLILTTSFLGLATPSIYSRDQISTLTQSTENIADTDVAIPATHLGLSPMRPKFEAGVLSGDFFNARLIYCLILVFRGVGKVSHLTTNRK